MLQSELDKMEGTQVVTPQGRQRADRPQQFGASFEKDAQTAQTVPHIQSQDPNMQHQKDSHLQYQSDQKPISLDNLSKNESFTQQNLSISRDYRDR